MTQSGPRRRSGGMCKYEDAVEKLCFRQQAIICRPVGARIDAPALALFPLAMALGLDIFMAIERTFGVGAGVGVHTRRRGGSGRFVFHTGHQLLVR